MNSIVYFKAVIILFVIALSIFLCIFFIKKFKLQDRFTKSNNLDLIQILEIKKIDQTKKMVIIKSGNATYTCILGESYGFLVDKKNGGESRIRTYERTRRADLQSAAFGHSATSPSK